MYGFVGRANACGANKDRGMRTQFNDLVCSKNSFLNVFLVFLVSCEAPWTPRKNSQRKTHTKTSEDRAWQVLSPNKMNQLETSPPAEVRTYHRRVGGHSSRRVLVSKEDLEFAPV